MNAAASSMTYARSGNRGGGVNIDFVTVGLVLGILLLGLVMVTSASVSIATKSESGRGKLDLARIESITYRRAHD